jgi:hypothetical protein
MSGTTSSRAALVLSAIALFVALGGTSYAAITLARNSVGTKQLKKNAVTAPKIRAGAVNGAKVADGSLTASDIAPNTFLGANATAKDSNKLGGQPPSNFLTVTGTAADSQKLGGLPANQYTQGRGSQVFRRAVVAPGGSLSFLALGFATLTGNCSGGNVPTISFTPSVSDTNYFATITTAPSTVSVDTLNAIPSGVPITEANGSGAPQMITIRDAYNDGVLDHVATAVATGEYLFGVGCVFTGQGLTTG